MASLVTLGSAPYNPYNTSFGQFAMQGLAMAQNEMNQRDQLAQASYQNYMKNVQFGADLLFRGQEMQLQRRKMDFTVDQAMFERKMAQEEMQFRKEQAAEGARRFDAGMKMDERRLQLGEDRFDFEKQVYAEAEPMRDLQEVDAATKAWTNMYNLQNLPEDRALGVRTREIQNQVSLSNAYTNAQNSDTAAHNAQTAAVNAETRAKQLEQYDRNRAAGIRAYDAQIKQKDQQIADAKRAVDRFKAEIRGSKKTTSPAVQSAEQTVRDLQNDLERLKSAKSQFEYQGAGAPPSPQVDPDAGSPEQQRVDDWLYRRRHGVDASLFPANSGDPTLD